MPLALFWTEGYGEKLLLGENKLLILENNQWCHPSTEEKLRLSFPEWTVRARARALNTQGEASGF